MVRVNHPPGGAAQIHGEAKREPKTVRVLKPPGGESSISFGDDADYHRQPVRSGASSSPSLQECDSPSGAAQALAFVEAPGATAAASSSSVTSAPEGKDVGDVSYDAKEVSSPIDSTNGTAPVELPTESPAEPSIPFPDPPKQSQSDVGSSNESNAEVVSCNGSSAVTSPDIEINGKDLSEIRSESCVNEVATTTVIKESEEVTSTSSESHQSSTEINSVEALTTAESSDSVTATEQNGSSPAKEKAPSPEPSTRPTGATPTSPTSVSTPKPGDDTTDRMFGRPTATTTPPQNPPPRKIKDHMRSSIFMSDEDYTPTRSSRMNAAVTNNASPNVPVAGQRQRIPPGGFSTKLW